MVHTRQFRRRQPDALLNGGPDMPKPHWSRPSKKEQANIDAVLNPAPEPPQHRCGVCYGPYGRSAIPCRNDPGTRYRNEQEAEA
jgi:hypothetical protein